MFLCEAFKPLSEQQEEKKKSAPKMGNGRQDQYVWL